LSNDKLAFSDQLLDKTVRDMRFQCEGSR